MWGYESLTHVYFVFIVFVFMMSGRIAPNFHFSRPLPDFTASDEGFIVPSCREALDGVSRASPPQAGRRG